MAVTESVKEAIWLKGLLEEISAHGGPTTIFCDSQSVIHLAKNHVYHERSKHIDVRYHFVRQVISKGIVEIKKIGTADNPADMLTKPIPTMKFNYCSNLISVGC